MTLFIADIADNIDKSDIDLNLIIQEFLDGTGYYGTPTTVAQWRITHYAKLRRWAYPPIVDYIDTQVKLNSKISEMAYQGEHDFDKYTDKILNIKTRFPKE